MRNHYNIVLGQRQIQLNGITFDLDSTLKCGHGILGVFSLEATMANDLWCRVWCVRGICQQLGPDNTRRLVGYSSIHILCTSREVFSGNGALDGCSVDISMAVCSSQCCLLLCCCHCFGEGSLMSEISDRSDNQHVIISEIGNIGRIHVGRSIEQQKYKQLNHKDPRKGESVLERTYKKQQQ